MKLFYNLPSPYARKVRVAAHELALFDRLELHESDPWIDPPELLAVNPLAKVPALVTDDGTLIADSTAICLYFDSLGGSRKLVAGEAWRVMARAALAQGLIDAAFSMVIERRRPAHEQSPSWIARQRRAIDRTLPRLMPGKNFDLGDITLACGLAYLDLRLGEIPWRASHPTLAQWHDGISLRPSMQATAA